MSFTDLKISNAVDMLLRDRGTPQETVLADLTARGFVALDRSTLDEHSAKLAGWIASQGIGQGDPVLIMQPMSARLYIALIAVLRLGAMAVFIDPANMTANFRAACRDLKPLGMIGPSRLLALGRRDPDLRSVRFRLRTNGWGWRSTAWRRTLSAKPQKTREIALTEPAIVTFSAGPSGYPLGVVRTHAQILEQHAAMSAVLAPLATSITATNVPAVALSNLALGIPTVLLRQADRKSVERLLRDSLPGTDGRKTEGRVTRLVLSPMVASQMVDTLAGDPLALEDVVVTGPLYPDIASKLDQALERGALRIAYGHPEVDPITDYAFADMMPADRLATSVGRGVLVGRPVPEVEVAILPDDYGMPIGPFSSAEFAAYRLEAGEVGEVVVCADHMVSHYVNGRSEAETKFSVDGRIWHRTGDAGALDAQGRLWLLGRCLARMEDELGTTYPLAVEAAARCQLGIRRLACVDHEGRSLLVIESAASLDVAMLQEVIGMTGISGIVVVDRLPMDRYQEAKVDYQRLMQMLTTRRDLVRMDFDDAGSA